jgi:carboxymethylenebutenolidase
MRIHFTVVTAMLLCGLGGSGLAAAADSKTTSDANSKVPAHQKHPLDSESPKPQGSMVDLTLEKGGTSKAYLAKPEGAPKGALLVVHEWWGLNDHIKAEADHFAKLGYLALAIDLYDGKVATSSDEAQKLMGALDDAHSTDIEKAGLKYLKSNAGGVKIGTIGWCMGGGQSLNASLADPEDVSVTVMYYGMPVTDVAKLKTLHNDAVLGIWANKDGWITPDKVKAFDKALTDAGIKHEFHPFDADHAFANPSGGKYNPEAAKQANAITEKFLAENFKK